MKTRIFTIFLMFIALGMNAQISIDSARTLGVGATVTVRGIVTNGGELGPIRYMQDLTAGIAVYSSSLSNVNRGDSIEVTGTIKSYNALLEIDPVTSFTVLSTGNTLPTPEITVPDSLNENREAELLRINGVTFTTNPGGTFSSNTSYNFTVNGQSSTIFVRSNHPLIGTVIPSGVVDLVGICSQYSYTSPTSGYQLLCRDTADIIMSNQIAMTSPLMETAISTSSITLEWTTSIAGTTELFYGSTPTSLTNHVSGTGTSTTHTQTLSSLSASELVYVRAFSVDGTDTAYSPVRPFITVSNSSGDIKVYFNQAVDNSVKTHKAAISLGTAIDDTLIAYINRAQSTIDFTMYNFTETNISSVSGALNAAHARGVVVRVIFDGSANNTGIQSLDPAIKKISSPTGANYGIMHNKFIIIDAADDMNSYVWTGSTNLTDGQINLDPNSVIIIQDKSLATAYTLEFDEMFGSTTATPSLANAKFGPDKMDNTPHMFEIGGRSVECYFSPSDGTNAHLIKTIESADDNMNIATMLITRTDIAYAIQDAVNNNSVATKILVNSQGQCSATVWGLLSTLLGNDLVEDTKVSGIMHHKYMIVDEGTSSDPTLFVGSHNWSNSANNKNDENTLIIKDDTLANIYYQAFKERFDANYVSIDVNNFATAVKIYPNPSNGQFSVEVNTENSFMAELVVYDLTGRIISSNNEQLHIGINTISIDLDNIAPGTYVLQMRNGDKQFVSSFIVK
jgi:phosphatidylserine/phosphatidylglycerophosphate/cardiolipin synthase-like enzyme